MSYTPSSMPPIHDVEELRKFLDTELTRIAQAFNEFGFVVMSVNNVAPTRPTAGMLAFADGTNWNPGSGRGLYEYRTSSWVKL